MIGIRRCWVWWLLPVQQVDTSMIAQCVRCVERCQVDLRETTTEQQRATIKKLCCTGQAASCGASPQFK
jgi:hypothetical protein